MGSEEQEMEKWSRIWIGLILALSTSTRREWGSFATRIIVLLK